MTRMVVITGVGPITGFGMGMDALWSAMLEGRSAIRRMQHFDPAGYRCHFASELDSEQFDVRKVVPKHYRKATKVMCRDVELAIGAAAAAIEDAGLVTRATDQSATPTIAPARFGCHIGAGLIAADVNELTASLISSRTASGEVDLAHWGASGMNDLTPLWLLKYLPNMLACHVTIVHDCQGPSNTITCCEASGALSLGESMRVIERGAADACLTGGAEFKLNPMGYFRQQESGRLIDTTAEDEPTTTVRPFDPAARGTLLGEGGALLVVEDLDTAIARGATMYAAVAGFVATQSFCPDTLGLQIKEDGEAISDAISFALHQAKLSADDIDAIVPFGSGIPHIDTAETAALRTVFGARTASIPIVTTIPHVGNCNAGNSAIALTVAAKCLREQKLPARLNTSGAVDLDANASPARDAKLEHVLVCTSSQGGQNAAVILRRASA